MKRVALFCLVVGFIHPMSNVAGGEPPAKLSDWPQWRGPRRDAVCGETGLLKDWPKDGPKLLWDSSKVNGGKSVGTGIASLAFANGKLFTMGDYIVADKKADKKVARKGDGFVFCLDADTGKEIWKTRIGPFFFNSYGSGGRCTPTVDGDLLYAISPHGLLVCLKTADGSLVWQKDFAKDFGGKMMSGWGYSESPTVDGDKLICTPGGKKAALVALDKKTGSTVWTCSIENTKGAGYASIVSAEVGGIKQYITVLDKTVGLVGVDAKTGKLLWNYDKAANGTANIPTAVVKGDLVFTSTGYNAGAALLKLVPDGKGGVSVEEQYYLSGKQLQNHHGGVVLVGDYLYGGHGNNDGKPFCLNWRTGRFAWGPERGPGSGSAAVLFADGNLYFRYQNGVVALVEATPKGFHLKSSFEAHIADKDWPHPVIYHGRLYLRGEDKILCYDIRK